jgi:hypothetical protein
VVEDADVEDAGVAAWSWMMVAAQCSRRRASRRFSAPRGLVKVLSMGFWDTVNFSMRALAAPFSVGRPRSGRDQVLRLDRWTELDEINSNIF